MNISVRTLPEHHVAYMRHVGPYGPHGIPDLWTRFHRWMDARGIAAPGRITLGIAHDDPEVTAPEKCRYDSCVVVPQDFTADRWVNLTGVPAGRFAVAQFVGTAGDIRGAWERIYDEWLPGSGFQPDDRACYEVYRGDPGVDWETRTFRCELCMPVRPL